jgi:hypothetical protein
MCLMLTQQDIRQARWSKPKAAWGVSRYVSSFGEFLFSTWEKCASWLGREFLFSGARKCASTAGRGRGGGAAGGDEAGAGATAGLSGPSSLFHGFRGHAPGTLGELCHVGANTFGCVFHNVSTVNGAYSMPTCRARRKKA